MQISRRGFIGGLVASATVAEAGILAEFFDWLRRRPKSFAAPPGGWIYDAVPIAWTAEIKISYEMLEDLDFDIERFLRQEMARRFARSLEAQFDMQRAIAMSAVLFPTRSLLTDK